jgi:hypothetical protein
MAVDPCGLPPQPVRMLALVLSNLMAQEAVRPMRPQEVALAAYRFARTVMVNGRWLVRNTFVPKAKIGNWARKHAVITKPPPPRECRCESRWGPIPE